MKKYSKILSFFQILLLIFIGLIVLTSRELGSYFSFSTGFAIAALFFLLTLLDNHIMGRVLGNPTLGKKWYLKKDHSKIYYANQTIYLVFFIGSILFFVIILNN